MTIDRKEIEALVRIFDQSDWHELRLETDGLRLVLSKDADTAALGPLGDATLLVGRDRAGGTIFVGVHAGRDGRSRQRR